ERRHNAHPEIKKAELIEGVVYMPSPVRHKKHGKPHIYISGWIAVYAAATPVVDPSDNATVRLDFENEVQPDILLRLEPEQGGHSRISEDDYIEGPPELVVEISASSVSYDLHTKRRVYARSGVQEYIAIQMYEKRIDWFVLREGVYEALAPDENGILRSEVFPGLWLDSVAFWADDLQKILAVLQDGLASESHADFANRLHEQ
ncbi:MAG: Uma2 family endonuclease, partial [Chloroflexi bacterium]|nr:Uma2 family endonuclease [Chloroflexota bacterium]